MKNKDMAKVGIIAIIILAVIGGIWYFTYNSNDSIVTDPVFPISQVEGYYEGEAIVGNEIIVYLVVEEDPSISPSSGMHALFYEWDWENFEPKASNCAGNPSGVECTNLEDTFEVDYGRRNAVMEGNQVTVSAPVKILKEGEGLITFEYVLSGQGVPPSTFSPGVIIKSSN